MSNESTIIRRRAQYGPWAVWRLLVACRIVETIPGAWNMVQCGEVSYRYYEGTDFQVADMKSYLTIGMFEREPVTLRIRGRVIELRGVGEDNGVPGWERKYPEADTTGLGSEPPIPGARMIIAKPPDLKRKPKAGKAPRVIVGSPRSPSTPGLSPEIDSAPF